MTMQRVEMPLGTLHPVHRDGADGQAVGRRGGGAPRATRWCWPPPTRRRDAEAGVDFLPLTVDYRENTYAAGKIPGGFFKREGRPNEKEILTSRMIDRPLRPLFPEGYNNETQVIGLLLSADLENDSDTLAITGASHRALPLRRSRSTTPGRRGARRLLGRPVRGQPDLDRAAHQEQAQPARRGHRGRHRHGGGGRPGDLRGRDGAGPRRGPRGHQADRGAAEGPAARGRASRSGRSRRRSSTPAS